MFVRALYNVAGTLFVALGVIGRFVPLMPTTVFLLLASACYMRGSPRMHAMLMGNRYLGPYIRNMQERRGMPLRAKVTTLTILWLSLAFSAYRLPSPLVFLILLTVGTGVTTLLVRMPTLRDAPAAEATPRP